MKHIEITKGLFTIVDDDVFEWASKERWFAAASGSRKTFYARRQYQIAGKKYNIALHSEILKPRPGFIVDHINGNGLDNRRENLREATHSQNRYNQGAPRFRNKSSKFKGVAFKVDRNKWRARLCDKHLGYFETEIEAAEAYNAAAHALDANFFLLNNLAA